MTREELEHALQIVEEELEEVDEMRKAVLGQTGVHVGARLLAQHRARFDRDQARLEGCRAEIRAQMASLDEEQPS